MYYIDQGFKGCVEVYINLLSFKCNIIPAFPWLPVKFVHVYSHLTSVRSGTYEIGGVLVNAVLLYCTR